MTAGAEASGNQRQRQAVAIAVLEGAKVEHRPAAEAATAVQEECR